MLVITVAVILAIIIGSLTRPDDTPKPPDFEVRYKDHGEG